MKFLCLGSLFCCELNPNHATRTTLTAKRKMIPTYCAACAAPLAPDQKKRCSRCKTRYCNEACILPGPPPTIRPPAPRARTAATPVLSLKPSAPPPAASVSSPAGCSRSPRRLRTNFETREPRSAPAKRRRRRRLRGIFNGSNITCLWAATRPSLCRRSKTRSLIFSQGDLHSVCTASCVGKQADARPDTNVCQIGCPVRLMPAREPLLLVGGCCPKMLLCSC